MSSFLIGPFFKVSPLSGVMVKLIQKSLSRLDAHTGPAAIFVGGENMTDDEI